MLVERDSKIVTREEIKSKLWGNDTVIDFDQAINTMIKALRRALGIRRTTLGTSRPWGGLAID